MENKEQTVRKDVFEAFMTVAFSVGMVFGMVLHWLLSLPAMNP